MRSRALDAMLGRPRLRRVGNLYVVVLVIANQRVHFGIPVIPLSEEDRILLCDLLSVMAIPLLLLSDVGGFLRRFLLREQNLAWPKGNRHGET